jgi:polyisoprenoid-binding protein YceI
MKYLILLFIVFSTQAKDYSFKDYETAKNSAEFLYFESESTKLGLITTDFRGYAKKFKVETQRQGNSINKVKVILFTKFLDTDNSSRDDKMYESILLVEKYPEITFSSSQTIKLQEGTANVKGLLKIRDIEKEVTLNLNIKNTNQAFQITGESSLGLKEFTIPDPSIAIASVRDRFDLKFRIMIEK